jgi:hypothetical protein
VAFKPVRAGEKFANAAQSRRRELVRLVPVFGFSIGGAAGCPQDAREKDCSDNGYDEERGRNHV